MYHDHEKTKPRSVPCMPQVLLANNVYSFYFSVTNSDATLNPPIWYLTSACISAPLFL